MAVGARRFAWAIVITIGTGCPGTSYFACEEDSECSSLAGGQCEASGACSFPDEDCPSGRRYGNEGPPHLAGECVDPADAQGTTTATTTGAMSTSSGGGEGEVDSGTTLAVDDGGSSSGPGSTSGLGSSSGEASTSDSSTSEGLGSGSGNTTPPPTDFYKPCDDNTQCEEVCIVIVGTGAGFCTFEGCRGPEDCPPGESGEEPVCILSAQANENVCALPCGPGQACPEGMDCFLIRGGASICAG